MLCSAFWVTKASFTFPEPQPWWIGGSVDGPDFNHLHKQVGHNGADGEYHSCLMHLFIIPTLEEDIGVLRQNFNSVVMCCIDMDVDNWWVLILWHHHFGVIHFGTRCLSSHRQWHHLWKVLILVSITFSDRPGEAMLFVMGIARLHFQIVSVG